MRLCCVVLPGALYSGYKGTQTQGDDTIGRSFPYLYMFCSWNIYPLRAVSAALWHNYTSAAIEHVLNGKLYSEYNYGKTLNEISF